MQYTDQEVSGTLLVVSGNSPSLMGRDWLQKIQLNWHAICQVVKDKPQMLEDVLQKHAVVFSEKMGVAKNIVAKIHVDPEATPKFYRARSVPYAIKGKIEQELQRLENEGVVSKVVESEWAAPIVPVIKSDGSVRLCGDYKVTVNQAIKSDSYPLPRTEDILASLAGGKAFCSHKT